LLIDMPGLREVALWATEESVESVFDDLNTLAAGCRFRDCLHQGEPGCAVAQAIIEGRIAAGRVESFHKLQREVESHDVLACKRRDRILCRAQQQMQRHEPKWRE